MNKGSWNVFFDVSYLDSLEGKFSMPVIFDLFGTRHEGSKVRTRLKM